MSNYILNLIATDGTIQLSVPIHTPKNVRQWLYTIKQDMEVELTLKINRRRTEGISYEGILDFFESWAKDYLHGSDKNESLDIQITNADTQQTRLFATATCASFDKDEKLVSLYLDSCKVGINDNVVYLNGNEYLSVATLLEEAADSEAVVIIMRDKDGNSTYSVSEGWKKESLWYAASKALTRIKETMFDEDDEYE